MSERSKDVATVAAAWLWSAYERFIETIDNDSEPEGMLDEITGVMELMLPADPALHRVMDAHGRLVDLWAVEADDE